MNPYGENRSETSQRVQKAEEGVKFQTAKHVPRVTTASSSGPSALETGLGFVPGGGVVTHLFKGEAPGIFSVVPGGEELENIGGVPGKAAEAGGELLVEGAEHLPVVGGVIKDAKSAAKTAEETGKALGNIAGDIGKLTEVKTWIRIGKVLAGAIIVIFGLWLLAKAVMGGNSNPAAPIRKAASAPIKYAGEKRAVSKALGKSEADKRARLAEHAEREAVTTRHAQKREAARRATVRARKRGNG